MKTIAWLAALLAAQDAGVPETVKKAQAKLATAPDDAEANLVVGKYLAFDQGAWETGIPLLAKGSDGLLKSIAEKDLAGGKDPAAQVDRGDEWIGAAAKRPALRAGCQERAAFWYRKAWLAAEAAAKDKLRDRFRKFAAPPPGYEKPVLPAATLSGWDSPNDYWKTNLDLVFAHSGRQSMKILPAGKDNPSGASGINSQPVAAFPGRKYTFSAWVFTDRTDADAVFRARVSDAAGKVIVDQPAPVLMDSPFWQKVQIDLTAPEGAFRVGVNVGGLLKQGAIWVDDVSIRVDGKELLKNGGFEEK